MGTLNVNITKAKRTIPVDTDMIPEALVDIIWQLGLETLLNAKQTKIKVAKLEGDDLAKARSAAFAQAEKNLEDVYAGKVTKRQPKSAEASGVDRKVMTEAMRLARIAVRDEIKEQGLRIKAFTAAQITDFAKQYIEADPSILETAKANLETRTVTKKPKLALVEDPKLVAKLEAEKSDRKKEVSAKQAGKTVPHKSGAKPGKESHATH